MQFWIINVLTLVAVVLVMLWLSSRKQAALNTRIELLQQLNQNLQLDQNDWQQQQQQMEQAATLQQQQILQLNRDLATSTEKLAQQAIWWQQLQQAEQKIEQLHHTHTQQQVTISELSSQLDHLQTTSQEKQQFLINSEQRLTEQFENLAHKIFEKSGLVVEQQHRQSLNNLLTPLKEQLEGFKKQVQDSFNLEAKERHTLTFEIRNLQQLNDRMTQEAVNLTKALKGDNKTQGNWGEVILQRLLELSGLQEGREFQTQCSSLNSEGRRLQPDVVINLPRQRHIIIDSKMTLIAYERYYNSDDDKVRQKALQEHLNAMRQHIKLLSSKAYHELPNLDSVDFVLMFIPIEGAFSLAIQQEPQLLDEALKQNILLASPANLLATLRTIHYIWRDEYQNQHAAKIADRATKLYDKFRLFVDDMETLGVSLQKAQDAYQHATNKLFLGRGNMITQIEQFRTLGISVKKPLANDILKKAEYDSEAPPAEADSMPNIVEGISK